MVELIKRLNRTSECIIDNSGHNTGIIAKEVSVEGSLILNQNIPIQKIKSLIPSLVKELAKITNKPDEEIEKNYKVSLCDLEEYNIPDKINFNNVIKYKEFVGEYSQYFAICEEAFNILDDNKCGTKKRILLNINQLYKEYKGELLIEYKNSGMDDIEIIRENADFLIEKVKDELKKNILNDYEYEELAIEEINDGLIRIICYAFVGCKILEKPLVGV